MVMLGSVRADAQQATPTAGSAVIDAGLHDAVREDQRDAIVAEPEGKLSIYRIDAEIVTDTAPEPSAVASSAGAAPSQGPTVATATGTLRLDDLSDTGVEPSSISCRLYPNDNRSGGGGIELRNVTVDGGSGAGHACRRYGRRGGAGRATRCGGMGHG